MASDCGVEIREDTEKRVTIVFNIPEIKYKPADSVSGKMTVAVNILGTSDERVYVTKRLPCDLEEEKREYKQGKMELTMKKTKRGKWEDFLTNEQLWESIKP